MIGIKYCGNSLGLATLMIFNLHLVCEVIFIIFQVMTISENIETKIHHSWLFYTHAIASISLACAFYGIFYDRPFFMLPQIIIQFCILVLAAVNVLSLSRVLVLVIPALSDYLHQPKNINYSHLYLKITFGWLFVVLYFCFLMVVFGYYKKLRKESKFNQSVLKSSTITEEMML